jgi:glycerol-3-phosphate dehydrogenase
MSEFDVVVVGGGIHGVGAAQAAAAAGHSVLLLEQRALASGSSSRSSKLIHGGLRYLESGQLRLVRESLHERTTLLRIAPELVRLRRFYIPIFRQTRRRPWQLRVGLSTYALLAGCTAGAGFGTLPRTQWHRLAGLKTAGLQKVFWYQDGQTDDALLTTAVMRSAQSLGARIAMPANFVGATLNKGEVIVRYSTDAGAGASAGTVAGGGVAAGAQQLECRCRVLINAAGPWAANVARLISPAVAIPQLELVQGTHMLLDLPAQEHIYYVESPRDGRAVFVMPWHERTLVGTTEVRFRGEPRDVEPTPHELHYLRGLLRHYFSGPWAEAPMLKAFAGLRVLPSGAGHAFHRSRETLLQADRNERPRVVSIYGGKLTTWRAVSARVLESVAASLPTRAAAARTDQLLLHPT